MPTARDVTAVCVRREVVQQRGLADTRFAANNEHASVLRPNIFQQPIQHDAPVATTQQP